MTGKVKFFVESKGWGYITDDESKKDVFFHKSGTIDRVVTEDLVSYEVEKGEKGLMAVNVKRIK